MPFRCFFLVIRYALILFVHLFVCLILRPPLRVMDVFFQLLRLVADVYVGWPQFADWMGLCGESKFASFYYYQMEEAGKCFYLPRAQKRKI